MLWCIMRQRNMASMLAGKLGKKEKVKHILAGYKWAKVRVYE